MSVAGEQRPCTMDLLSHVTPRPLLGEAQAQPPLSLTVIKVCTAFPYRYVRFPGKDRFRIALRYQTRNPNIRYHMKP